MTSDDAEIRGIVARIADVAAYFSSFAGEQTEETVPDPLALIESYIAARRQLVGDFMALAQTALVSDPHVLADTIAQLNKELDETYRGDVPDRLLHVRGYGAAHRTLLEYLFRHSGEPVPVSLLRVLVGDQVHTERRLRELRDLGFDLRAHNTAGEDHYLLDAEADFAEGARTQLANNIKSDRKLSANDKTELIVRLGLVET